MEPSPAPPDPPAPLAVDVPPALDRLPVLGQPSPASAGPAALRAAGTAADAAFRAEGGDGDWCAVRAASVAGVRHRLAGQPGQDGFAWAWQGDRLAVAVADGLGGVPGSDTTATRAGPAAVGAAVAAAGSPSAQVAAGLEAANRAAAGGGATTIIVAVVSRSGEVALGRVGDSTAFLVAAGSGPGRELFSPPAGDGVGTVTAALPDAAAAPETGTAIMATGDLLVLVTDGIADPWRDGPTTVAPVLAAALAQHPAPLGLAQLVDFSRRGCHDDRTLLAVWLAEPHPEPHPAAETNG